MKVQLLLLAAVAMGCALGDMPDSFDWCEKITCSSAKNSGQCGGEAVNIATLLELSAAAQKGQDVSVSVAQLEDCAGGCSGMNLDKMFKWIEANGVCSSNDYPTPKGKCDTSCTPVVKVSAFTPVQTHNATALAASILRSPTLLLVDAASTAFQFYTGGVIKSGCGDNIDHAVVATAYGKQDDVSPVQNDFGDDEVCYVTAQNDWGSSWGEKGYVSIARACFGDNSHPYGPDGECGILMSPYRAVIA